MKVEDALVVGQSPAFDCTTDTIDVVNDVNYALASKARSWRIGSKGKIGISTPQFGAGSNAASDKPFANMMTYQSLGGRMEIKGEMVYMMGKGTDMVKHNKCTIM